MVMRNALLFCFVAITLIVLSPPALAENTKPLVRLDPLALGLRTGAQGSLTFRAENVSNLYGIEFHLSFDPNVVQVVDMDPAKPGTQIAPSDWLKNTFVAVNKADNTTGKIDYAVTLLNPAPPVSGSGAIATVTFKAKSDGTSPLKIDQALLATREAKEIKAIWQDAAIGVSVLGNAPSVQQQPRGNVESPDASSDTPSWGAREFLLIGLAGAGAFVFIAAIVAALGAVFLFRGRR